MHSEYERELRYGDPKLRDLKPGELKFFEWMGFGVLWLLCVVLGGLGVLTVVTGWAWWGTHSWYFTAPVVVSGVAAVVCAILLGVRVSEARDKLVVHRERLNIVACGRQANARGIERLEKELATAALTLDSCLRLARDRIYQRDGESALRVLGRALQDHPAAPELYLLLGKANALRGDIDATVEAWGRCRELSRSDSEVAALENAQMKLGIALRHSYVP